MDLWPSKGQSRGPEPRAGAPLPGKAPRFPGWQPGAACRSRSPLPAMRRQAGPGRAETHVPSLDQGSQHLPRSSCGCFDPSACPGGARGEGLGGGDFAPHHSCGAEAQQTWLGALVTAPHRRPL